LDWYKNQTHNLRSPPEEMSETPHGDTNSGRTGSGVEVNAIGCWHAVAETGLHSSSTLLVAVSTQDL
jgi:hypothetical protein